MLQRARTYQAKTYVPVASAAIDPYEEERNSLVDDERLDRWFHYVEKELQRYRSPFVAAEALLTELRLYNAELYQPERLYVNTALRILQACVPHLSPETAEVVHAAIHELLPCLLYTRRTPLSAPTATGTAASPRGPLEQITQLTYAGAFRRVLKQWQKCQAQLKQQERRVRIEVKVMDRLVHELDHMWVKTCFYSWRTYCRQLQVRKDLLRRRLLRSTANEAAPRFLRAWRQYAHTIALDVKTSRNSALQLEVEALYPLEHQAKSRHDHLSQEIQEKNRLVGESLQRLEEQQDRLRALESLMAEVQGSLTDHWSTWKECMQLLFGDVGTLPDKSEDAVRMDYLMNFTDTAASLAKRAHTKAGRNGLRQIGKLLLFEGALSGGGSRREVDRRGSGTAAEKGEKKAVGGASGTALRRRQKSKENSSKAAAAAALSSSPAPSPSSPMELVSSTDAVTLATDVHRVFAAVGAVARPVQSPLQLMDVLHCNEPQLHITLAFLSTLYSGGHCSLFAPALRLKDKPSNASASMTEVSSAAPHLLLPAEAAADADAAAKEVKEVHWGALMVQDVSTGMRKLQGCTDMNERYLIAVRQCMMSSEVDTVQGYLEELFNRWAITGLPLSRAKLEAVWEPLVPPNEFPIIKALFPTQGITSFAELANYVTRVAEFSGRPLLALAERLDATYAYDPIDELRILRRSEAAEALFREYAAQVSVLLDWLRDGISTSEFSSAHLAVLLEVQLGLSADEKAEVLEAVKREGGDVVERDDVEWMLILTAAYIDPSPFSSPLEKLAALLAQCTPFLTQLSKNAKTAS